MGAGIIRVRASPDSKRAGAIQLAAVLSLLIMAASLAACGRSERELGPRVVPVGQPAPKGGGTYKVGEAYQINGRWYHPREDPGYDRTGTASWYGELFHGRYTANGEIYDMERLSAAHPTLPMPTYARVTNLENGRTLIVRVNDRGPYANSRIIDLSKRSAELLGFAQKGTTRVRVTYLGKAPLDGDDSYERRFAAAQPWMQMAEAPRARSKEPLIVGSVETSKTAPTPPSPAPSPQREERPRAGIRTVAAYLAPAEAWTEGITQGGFKIQAASFRSRENAERARAMLGAIAPVEIAPIKVGGETYYRVRTGPFSGQAEAQTALAKVTAAGFADAKIILK